MAHTIQVGPKTLYNWYKFHISDYIKQKEEKSFPYIEVAVEDEKTNKKKTAQVYILEEKNMGEVMQIDEKYIGKKYSVILSNQATGKIAMLVETMNPILIEKSILCFSNQARQHVKTYISDMSPTLKKVCKNVFPNGENVVDKFHVIKHVIDAFNAVRISLKKSHKFNQNKDENPFGFSDLELLEKSKYLFYKNMLDLKSDEQNLVHFTLHKFPTLKAAYQIMTNIRNGYTMENKTINFYQRKAIELNKLMKEIFDAKIKPMKTIYNLFERHHDEILNYFLKGYTNAKAENLNARIQRFLTDSYGTRDKEFFFFRVKTYFA